MSTILTVANQKGGVGKTTSVMNLGVALHRAGQKVLLIDSDPQANLTSYLGIFPGDSDEEPVATLDELYLSKRPEDSHLRERLVTPTESGPDLIAAEQALSGVEYYLINRPEREKVLARFLAHLASRYDTILIDTPPSLNLLTLNALSASTHVLIPVQPEFFSLEGVIKIRKSIEDVRTRWNPDLRILGVLPTQVSHRRKLTDEVLKALGQELGDQLFESRIHDNASVTESSGHGVSVLDYDRASRGAKDYEAAAQEIIMRIKKERSRA
jgi:chromosome partitioning protein